MRNSQRRLYALGRLKAGEMNKTEKAYASYLDGLMLSGDVLWYKFEGIKLMIAKNTSITVDFAVLPKTGVLEMHDCKGSKAIFSDDARAKMKVAAAAYPFIFKALYPRPAKEGGGWEVEEF